MHYDNVKKVIYLIESTKVKKIGFSTSDTTISTIFNSTATSADGMTAFTFKRLDSLIHDSSSDILYIGDSNAHTVYKVTNPNDSSPKISKLAGTINTSGSTDGVPGTLSFPILLGIYSGSLYLNDNSTYLRKIDLSNGRVQTVLNGSSFNIDIPRSMGNVNTRQIYLNNNDSANISSLQSGYLPTQPLAPPYYFGFASLNYGYDPQLKHTGDIGLYLLGTKPNGEVAAYHQFVLTAGKDLNTTKGTFSTTKTGIIFGFGNPETLKPNNYQIVMDPNYSTNGNGIIYVIELSTGYTMIIMNS